MTIGLVLLSRLLGLARDVVLAHQFGQGTATDSFRKAFAVPDLIALVIAGGALSSVFIPVFADYWNEKREDEAWRMFGSVMSIVGVIVAALVLLMEAGVIPLTALLNPGFYPDGEKAGFVQILGYFFDALVHPASQPPPVLDTAALTRILLPVQWCLMVGGLMMGTLYARKRFLVPNVAPLLYNLGQIIGCLLGGFLAPKSVQGLAYMAWGALIGAFVGSVLLPLFDMARVGVRWQLGFHFRHPGVVRVGQLMVPVILGQSLSQLNMWLTGRFTGNDFRYPALYNAYTLTQAPIGIFAQAFGIVLLPTISALAASQEWVPFRRSVSQGLRRVLFLTVPCSVLMASLAVPLICLFYKGHAFTSKDVPAAATSLVCYSIATFAWSGSTILQRGFWAVQDTKTPIYITTPLVVVFIAMAWIYTRLIDSSGYVGLALSTSFLGIVSFFLFLFYLQKRVGKLNLRAIVVSGLKIMVASLLAGGASYALSAVMEQRLAPGGDGTQLTRSGAGLILVIAGGLGILLYALLAVLLRIPELHGIGEMFRRRSRAADAPPSAPSLE